MRDLRGLIVTQLRDFQPSAFSTEVLSTLQRLGINNPTLFGGALRDHWMGVKISDYDVWGHWEKMPDPAIPPAEVADKMMTNLESAFPDTTRMDYNITQREIAANREKVFEYHFTFRYQGSEISLLIDRFPLPLENKIRGDAPINTIVMDAAGKVLAHPLFEQHARQKVFQPYNHHDPDEDEWRFTKLKKKIPELKYMWGSWLGLYSFYSSSLTRGKT